MSLPKFAKYALTVASAATALLAAPAVGLGAAAQAAPAVPMLGFEGPVDSYAMGDSMNCYIDYTMWIDRNAAEPHRVIAHFQPRGVRPTIPGTPAPANCSATLAIYSATDRNPLNINPNNILSNRLDRLDADQTGGVQVQFDMPYDPDAGWVNLNAAPVTSIVPFAGFVAYPWPVIPTTAFTL